MANWGRADICGRHQRRPGENGQTVTWKGDRSGGGSGRAWGNLCTLSPATESVELISRTRVPGETGEFDEVPDGLYSGFWLSDLSEHGRPGPTTQLRTTTWSWCVCFLPPRGIIHITLGTRYTSIFVLPDVRHRHRQIIFLWSLGALSRSKTN